MREGPRQPRNLDPAHESLLASVGHRIEAWEAMKDAAVPLEERKEKMIHVLETEISALQESGDENSAREVDLLYSDIADVRRLQGNEKEIARMCQNSMNFWMKFREAYLREL